MERLARLYEPLTCSQYLPPTVDDLGINVESDASSMPSNQFYAKVLYVLCALPVTILVALSVYVFPLVLCSFSIHGIRVHHLILIIAQHNRKNISSGFNGLIKSSQGHSACS